MSENVKSEFKIFSKRESRCLDVNSIFYALIDKKHPFKNHRKYQLYAHYHNTEDITYSEKLVDFCRLMLTPHPSK
jgi:hypothetical protein